jgi:hypothetical protein
MKTLYSNLLEVLLLCLLLHSCRFLGVCEDANLSLQRITSAKNYLKVNGFYYADTNNTALRVVYLYDNGVMIKDSSIPLIEVSTYQVKPQENAFLKSCKGCWGVFNIENNKIIIESWQSNFNGCVSTVHEEGKILNDTTFVVKTINNRVLTYRFMASNSKPDSTNNFIK